MADIKGKYSGGRKSGRLIDIAPLFWIKVQPKGREIALVTTQPSARIQESELGSWNLKLRI